MYLYIYLSMYSRIYVSIYVSMYPRIYVSICLYPSHRSYMRNSIWIIIPLCLLYQSRYQKEDYRAL